MLDRIDINCDMGESYGVYKLGRDAEVMEYISSANIACGCHGGDPMVMDYTVRLAKEKGVAVGAHPGYPDLMGFGRRRLDLTLTEIGNYIIYQMAPYMPSRRPMGSLYSMSRPTERWKT